MRLAMILSAASLAGAVVVGAKPIGAQDTLSIALRASGLTLELKDGRLTGPGARVLLDGGRESQFFLIGEEHGVAQVPQFAAALFRELGPAGYRYFAIETGDVLATALNRAVAADTTGAAQLAFMRTNWPAVPFYFWREDAAMLREVVRAAGRRQDVLWGLDYDVLADRYALRRLRQLAPNADARGVVDGVIAGADSALARALAERNPGRLFMWGGPTDVYAVLRAAYRPARDSEADRIIALMEETRAINGLFLSGQVYESNLRRARLNKRSFRRYYEAARSDDGREPRVMMKFGASHMMRGRGTFDVFDVGNMASEIAEANGSRSFGVLVLGGAGSRRAQIDPREMKSFETGPDYGSRPWARPFLAAADTASWTAFDLRPLRARVRGLGALPEGMRDLLFAFDAVVILSGSTPQHDLEHR